MRLCVSLDQSNIVVRYSGQQWRPIPAETRPERTVRVAAMGPPVAAIGHRIIQVGWSNDRFGKARIGGVGAQSVGIRIGRIVNRDKKQQG